MSATRKRGLYGTLWGLAFGLLGAGLWVRGIESEPALPPEDVIPEEPIIQSSMQFLSGGSRERVGELDAWVDDGVLVVWKASRGVVYGLRDCPRLLDWMEGPEGLRVERLLGDLRAQDREEALAALTLIFQLARGADWAPGFRGKPQHAEKLGSLLQAWLRVWADRSAEDPVLHQPALAAALVYANVMRVAWKAPVVGHNEAAYSRATRFLDELCGTQGRQRTPFGRVLQARYARAFSILEGDQDRLKGLAQESGLAFPDVRGGCD